MVRRPPAFVIRRAIEREAQFWIRFDRYMFFAVRRIELSEKEPALREVDVFTRETRFPADG